MTHRPHSYSLSDHLSRLLASSELEAAAKDAGKTLADFRAEVTAELERLTEEQSRLELSEFETILGRHALNAAKAKARKAAFGH